MNSQDLAKIVEAVLEDVISKLRTKGKEYANPTLDRLSNFRTSADLQGITPEAALRGMVSKQIVSISDGISRGVDCFTIHQWEEKIHDVIVYMILLEALIKDKPKKKQS